MQLRSLPIADLIPAPYNPRRALKPGSPGWRRLERSLREFDLVQPIVWNETTGHVVGGHQRLEILKHQGHTTIDAVVVRLPLEREKALNIALNNSLVGGEWDSALLVDLLDELNNLPDFDATLTGFNERALNDLLLQPAPNLVEDPPTSDTIRVTLEIPQADWETIRPELDDLARRTGCQLHVA